MRLILSYWTFKQHILGGRISEGAGLWTLLPSTNKLCHAVSLHMRVFCLGGVSALLCMMTSLGNSLPASGSLALLPMVCPFEGLHNIDSKSCQTSEVKLPRAWLVLGWGTAWEHLQVLSALLHEALRGGCDRMAGSGSPPPPIRHRPWRQALSACGAFLADGHTW